MQTGFLYLGDDEQEIWGSAITTYYLAQAFSELGHSTWRASMTTTRDWSFLPQRTDLVISEGVPADRIPDEVFGSADCVVFWWLSSLFCDAESLARSRFDAVATNSATTADALRAAGVVSARIDLAAPRSFDKAEPRDEYREVAVFVGTCANKADEQMDMLLRPAARFGLSIWGYGWQDSPYRTWYKGPLPLLDIGSAYTSAQVVLAMTEERQKRNGMINNRIYEALACGSIIVSDAHPGLRRHELGRYVHFFDSSAEVSRFIESLLGDSDFRARCERRAAAGRQVVLECHTYAQRASDFLTLCSAATQRRMS